MKICADRELLAVYDALPDLLALARQRAKMIDSTAIYEIQDELREACYAEGTPFRWSMLYRSLFACSQCGFSATRIAHTLVNPAMKERDPDLHLVGISEEDIHRVREHGAAFSAGCRKFLQQIAAQK